jgi:hypothetical protein
MPRRTLSCVNPTGVNRIEKSARKDWTDPEILRFNKMINYQKRQSAMDVERARTPWVNGKIGTKSSAPEFTFIHVPKTGGRSVRVALGQGATNGEPLPVPEFLYEDGAHNPFCFLGHVPATYLRNNYPERFNKSFKFSFVRNPWDRVVSSFFWINDTSYDSFPGADSPYAVDNRPESTVGPSKKNWNRNSSVPIGELRNKFGIGWRWKPGAEPPPVGEYGENFRDFVKHGLAKYKHKIRHLVPQWFWVTDRKKIDVDFLGKFENFQADYDTVCDRINVPRHELPHEHKTKHLHYKEYYDRETIDIVGNIYWKDIDFFNYTF